MQISKNLLDELPKNEELKKEFIDDPVKVIKKYKSPLDNDKWIYRSVVWVLGVAVILCIIFSFYLSSSATKDFAPDIPQFLIAIGSGALGGLTGLLAPSPKSKS
jgi:hypothetical protein